MKVSRLLKVRSLSLLFKLKCKQILIDYFVCHSLFQVVAMQLQQSGDKKGDTCVEMLAYTFVYQAYDQFCLHNYRLCSISLILPNDGLSAVCIGFNNNFWG